LRCISCHRSILPELELRETAGPGSRRLRTENDLSSLVLLLRDLATLNSGILIASYELP
jgi:hypothetical protein